MKDESPLVMALKKHKESLVVPKTESERLLEMILEQVTKVSGYLMKDENEDKNESVTTQESHTP